MNAGDEFLEYRANIINLINTRFEININTWDSLFVSEESCMDYETSTKLADKLLCILENTKIKIQEEHKYDKKLLSDNEDISYIALRKRFLDTYFSNKTIPPIKEIFQKILHEINNNDNLSHKKLLSMIFIVELTFVIGYDNFNKYSSIFLTIFNSILPGYEINDTDLETIQNDIMCNEIKRLSATKVSKSDKEQVKELLRKLCIIVGTDLPELSINSL